MANAVQFQQVLVNLCVNARDATNGNGVSTVSAAPVQLEPVACASCHQNFSGRFVALTVEDTGEGIPEAARLRIFEPFFTTKAQGKGSGMGLAMVHGIVHRQGGHILLDSRPGAGTRFRLLMPVSADALEETPAQPSAVHRLSAATANIMVVDDEPTVAGFMSELLELSGYTVSVFTAPEAALKAFEDDPGRFDLVVTDQTMPGLTGDQLAARMMPLKPGLPIILVSGHSAVVDEKTALGLGIRAFLRKPLRHAALLEQIHAALQLTPDLD
jgi:CheY-like chemotaxis protein